MTTRRVVAVQNASGKSVVWSDGAPPWYQVSAANTGAENIVVWSEEGAPTAPFDGVDQSADLPSYLPPAGGVRFVVGTFPPDANSAKPGFDGEAYAEESRSTMPDLFPLFERDGMHKTPSVDFGIVLEGHPQLELDDGAKVSLHPGDTYVLHGVRHAWRNPTTEIVRVAVVLVGAAAAESA